MTINSKSRDDMVVEKHKIQYLLWKGILGLKSRWLIK